MAKPPAGSSLLFGALAHTGRIRRRKNDSYTMVLRGVDEIDWFTDRPDRKAGIWKPKRLLKQWNSFFKDDEPNAQVTYSFTTVMDLLESLKGVTLLHLK